MQENTLRVARAEESRELASSGAVLAGLSLAQLLVPDRKHGDDGQYGDPAQKVEPRATPSQRLHEPPENVAGQSAREEQAGEEEARRPAEDREPGGLTSFALPVTKSGKYYCAWIR